MKRFMSLACMMAAAFYGPAAEAQDFANAVSCVRGMTAVGQNQFVLSFYGKSSMNEALHFFMRVIDPDGADIDDVHFLRGTALTDKGEVETILVRWKSGTGIRSVILDDSKTCDGVVFRLTLTPQAAADQRHMMHIMTFLRDWGKIHKESQHPYQSVFAYQDPESDDPCCYLVTIGLHDTPEELKEYQEARRKERLERIRSKTPAEEEVAEEDPHPNS